MHQPRDVIQRKTCLGHGIDTYRGVSVRPCLGHGIGTNM
ncbi:hypothetical protein F383_36463 [Gossypium arboreum]|uniref:Uncharacterized protein n=1 Tax=Gossypium arboreum TaxID=29729 RepID=A0A0B0NDN6_GOSAR|nr:hypothetical protein F383_36463 [Gossypium arboreum]